MHLGPTKTATQLARSRSVRIGVVRLEKKFGPANLSAKRQLSVAKLSAKRNVSLAKRDFLVANGRMAADFSSPEFNLTLIFSTTLSRFGSGPCRPTAVQARSHLNTQLPNADTIHFFFFGPRKRGVRPHPPNPPWLRACIVVVVFSIVVAVLPARLTIGR